MCEITLPQPAAMCIGKWKLVFRTGKEKWRDDRSMEKKITMDTEVGPGIDNSRCFFFFSSGLLCVRIFFFLNDKNVSLHPNNAA